MFNEIHPFEREIQETQSKYKIVKKGITQQSSYNLSLELEKYLLEKGAIKRILDKGDANHIYYELNDGVTLQLSKNIIDLIGENYNHSNNKVYFDHTISGVTEKFQIKRKDHNINDERFKWFVQLYDKNFEGSLLKIYYDEANKKLVFDNDFRLNKNISDLEVTNDEVVEKSNIELFREYYIKNIDEKEANETYYKTIINTRENFVKEYPLEDLKNLTLEQYAYDVNYQGKPSLCYELATGKFSKIIDIHVGSHGGKFGIYMHSDKKAYCGKNDDVVSDPEALWEQIRDQIYHFLKDVENDKFDELTKEKYPLIFGMNLLMTKLSVLYFPEKLLGMGSIGKLTQACELFGVDFTDSQCSATISHNLSNFIKENVDEVNEHDPQYIADLLFDFLKLPSEEIEFSLNEDGVTGGYNMIYYGTPGCGKSYQVNDHFNENDFMVFRTTFHPEYSSSDFIGQIMPVVKDEGVEYIFQEGPFSLALLNALKNRKRKVCLIIEEINRGNASAIFGDIFQLLDRDSNGNSVYQIVNKSLSDFLCKKGEVLEKIFIPSNLWIIATMNTSDQNVFTLDTAFKRRWRMHRIANKFNMDEEHDRILANLYIPGSSYTWQQFLDEINDQIMKRNPTGLNSEDKQLGVYFATENELSPVRMDPDEKMQDKFIEKVLLYIWDDVAKIDPSLWFDDQINSFEKLVEKYHKDKLKIFKGMFQDEETIESLDSLDE